MRVGISSRGIDPEPGALLGGYPDVIRAMAGVHDSLMLSAAYITDELGKELLLVAFDGVATSPSLATAARASVGPDCTTVVLASHTHSAPALAVPSWDQGVTGAADVGYERWLAEEVRAACEAAVASAASGEIRVGSAELRDLVGSNRRHPGGPGDPRVRVIELRKTGSLGSLLLAIHGCHPTVLGPDNLWGSADLALGLRTGVADGGYDGAVQLLIGGAGDQSTRSTRRASTFDEALRLGGALGEAAMRALVAARPVEDFAAVGVDVDVPIRVFPDEPTAQASLDEVRATIDSHVAGGAPTAVIRSLQVMELGMQHELRRARNPLRIGASASLELTVLRLGSQRVVFAPVEPFLGPALELERDARAWLVGYANDYLGYLLPDEEIVVGGYELAASPFGIGTWDAVRTAVVSTLEAIGG